MNETKHKQNHADIVRRLRQHEIDLETEDLLSVAVEWNPCNDGEEPIMRGWYFLTIRSADQEWSVCVKPEQLLAIRKAIEQGMAHDPHYDYLREWIDSHWEDVEECLDAPADDPDEWMDQIMRAELAFDEWQSCWIPESSSEILQSEYCEILGIDATATYLDAWMLIDERLASLPLDDEDEEERKEPTELRCYP